MGALPTLYAATESGRERRGVLRPERLLGDERSHRSGSEVQQTVPRSRA